MGNSLLVTGLPATGKTTLVMRVGRSVKGFKAAGFCTEEIRNDGARKGFELFDVGGGRTLLPVPFLQPDATVVIIAEKEIFYEH